MARNRKRRSDRRPHRPATGPMNEPGVATASGSRPEPSEDAGDAGRNDAPEPLRNGAPDVELAEAQLAAGRAQVDGEDESAEDFDAEEDAEEMAGEEPAPEPAAGGRGHASVPAVRSGNRLVHFAQGSWRELQRVQWPDRRQVMQATSVVIGFVIVAGVFLGVADLVANKVVQFILK